MRIFVRAIDETAFSISSIKIRVQKALGVSPRGFHYWLESAAGEPLEILRVTAKDQSVDNKRVDHTAQKQRLVNQRSTAV